MKKSNASGESRKEQAEIRPGHRKFAEWVTLGISAAIILALAGYLVVEALQKNEPFVPVEVQPRIEEARELHGRFILPVQVANRGHQTLRDVKIALQYKPDPSAPPESSDLLIDYLGERSEQTAYFYLDQHPNSLQVEARALSYRTD